MAIAKRARIDRWLKVLAAGLLVVAALWWLYGDTARALAQAGTSYGAKNACSCRYISDRETRSCETDFLSRMRLIWLIEDEQARSMTATMPLVSRSTATYREGFGCLLEPWEG